MVELELRLDSINYNGGAVFGTTGLEIKWYFMRDVDDELHLFDPRKDRIQHPKGIHAVGYERGKIFKSTEEAVRYVKAVARFDYLVWFIAEFFGRDHPEVSSDLIKKAVDVCKHRIEQEGSRPVLELIPGLKDVVRFLDMSPEEVSSELWKGHLTDTHF